MKKEIKIFLALIATVISLSGFSNATNEVAAVLSDSEIWNKGVEEYRKGDYTNACATLQPLMLSRTHGARASELVGAMMHTKRKGEFAEDPVAAASSAENAVKAMQTALRSNPDDPRLQRNFTRAADGVEELNSAAHVNKVLKELGSQGPDQIIARALTETRSIMEEQKYVFTNSPADVISKSEALAKRAEKLADYLIPVKQSIASSVTNEQQAAYIINDIENTRSSVEKAIEKLADLSPDADGDLASSESAFYRFRKMTISPPDAIDEGIKAQTNAFADVEEFNSRPWQPEALDFTRAFRAGFPQWAQQYEQQAQSDTNKPPFTKEAQAEISALATEVEKKQLGLEKNELPQVQQECITMLERIRELLPKDNNSQNNQNNQNQNQDQNKDNQQNKDQQQNQDENKNNEQNQDENKEQKQEEQKQQSAEEVKDQKDIDDLLRKALERSAEHENDKKERARKLQPRPNERDW
jgi:hypothetical protein